MSSLKEADAMGTYRILWLSICVPLGVIGTLVALADSPGAVLLVFVAFGAVGSLLSMLLVGVFWERGTGVERGSWPAGHCWPGPASVRSSGTRPSWAAAFSCSQPWSWPHPRTR
jgi:Na+/proline symporter